MVLEKTLESPLDSKEIKPKEMNPEYSLEGKKCVDEDPHYYPMSGSSFAILLKLESDISPKEIHWRDRC